MQTATFRLLGPRAPLQLLWPRGVWKCSVTVGPAPARAVPSESTISDEMSCGSATITGMDWESLKAIVTEIVGEFSADESAAFEVDVDTLVADLKAGRDIRETYRAERAAEFELGPHEIIEGVKFILFLWSAFKTAKELRDVTRKFVGKTEQIAREQWKLNLLAEGTDAATADRIVEKYGSRLAKISQISS